MHRLILVLFLCLTSYVSVQAAELPYKMLYTCSIDDRVIYLIKNEDLSFALLDSDGVRFLQGSFQMGENKHGVPVLAAVLSGTFVLMPADGQRLAIIYPDTTQVEYRCR